MVVLQRVSSGTGETITMGLDIRHAPVPQRRYATDICSLEFDGSDVKIVFAQKCLFGDGIESALLVSINPSAAKQFVESLQTIKNPSVEEIMERVGIEPILLSKLSQAPKQMVSVVANFGAVAVAGWESCIDFYHASPFAIRNIDETKNQLDLESVVRVDIRTALFATLTKELVSLLPRLNQISHG